MKKKAKSHGDYKGLDAAILKATSYDHVLPKEKHIRTIFQSLSPSNPRAEVVYCIDGLNARLSNTHDWPVALKVLIVMHRALRELDYTVWQEFVNCSKARGYFIDITNFENWTKRRDLDYCSWVGNYAAYLEQRLRCFTMMNYDAVTYSDKRSPKLDTKDLLDQLPALQVALLWLLSCKPRGGVAYNRLIQYALSMITGESVKLYVAITVRVVELLEKFFEMNRTDAVNALKIYKNSGGQAEKLSKFFEACRSLDFGRGQKFINIKQPPVSFIATMEEYIKEAPSPLMLEYNVDDNDDKGDTTSVGDLLTTDDENKPDPSSEKNEAAAAPSQAADLMGLYDLLTGASEFEENSLALAVIPAENSLNSNNDENGASPDPVTGWEVALFTEGESSNDNVVAENINVVAESKEDGQAGGLDLLKLDNLYDEANAIAVAGTQQNAAYHIGQVAPNPFDFQASHDSQYNMAMAPPNIQNASYVPPNMAYPIPSQMSCMTYQDYYMMQQQHLQQQQELQHQQEPPFIMNKKSTNPFELDEPNILPTDPTQNTSSG